MFFWFLFRFKLYFILLKHIFKINIGDFNADDVEMRKKSLNRIGNILVPSNTKYLKYIEHY